jgi:hypothetical protein
MFDRITAQAASKTAKRRCRCWLLRSKSSSSYRQCRSAPISPPRPATEGCLENARLDKETGRGAGFLTGKIDASTKFDASDFRTISPRFTEEARTANQGVVELLNRMGSAKNATPAQIALAWLLAQTPWVVPIPGTTKLHRLEENIGAANVELSAQDLKDIEAAFSNLQVTGARLPEQVLAMSNG